MGRVEKVAKLEALLERVQQRTLSGDRSGDRAQQLRAHESGAVSVAGPRVTTEEVPATRRRPPAVDVPAARSSASSLPTRPAPAISPIPSLSSPRRTPIASPVSAPLSPRAFPTSAESRGASPPVSLEASHGASLDATAPDPSPVTTVAASPLPILTPREALLTPTATILTPHASERPVLRLNPEMTAPVSAEEVAAAAARMNKVPTFPDAWPIDAHAASQAANATSAAVAASRQISPEASVEVEAVFPLSGPKFDVGQPTKDLYLEEGEEPTKPLAHPPRSAPPKAAQHLATPLPIGTLIGAPPRAPTPVPPRAPTPVPPPAQVDAPKARPATIPFDAYPPVRSGDGAPLSDAASPRAMIVPREVENQPAFLSNLRQPKEGGSGTVKALLVLLVLAAGGYAAYAMGYLNSLLGEPPKK